MFIKKLNDTSITDRLKTVIIKENKNEYTFALIKSISLLEDCVLS